MRITFDLTATKFGMVTHVGYWRVLRDRCFVLNFQFLLTIMSHVLSQFVFHSILQGSMLTQVR